MVEWPTYRRARGFARIGGGGDRGLPGLPAAGGLARAGGDARSGPPSPARTTGAGRCPASATRPHGCSWSGWRRRPTAATAPGRVFTGDRSGDWLFRAMYRAGLANQPTSISRDDGLRLTGAYVAAAVRCAPPANKPTPDERDRCRPFLERELALLAELRVVVCLGAFAYEVVAAVARRAAAAPLRPRRRGRRPVRADDAVLVPPQPAEHLHGPAHRADARRRLRPGGRTGRAQPDVLRASASAAAASATAALPSGTRAPRLKKPWIWPS